MCKFHINFAKSRKQNSAYSLLVSLLFSPVTFAEEHASESSLEAISVVSDEVRTTQTESKESYTTSAMSTTTGLLLTPKETPQSVSVITNTQIKEQGLTSIADALKMTTGVNVISSNGFWRFQSRGFYIDQIEEDGIASTVPGSSSNIFRDSQSMTNLAIYDHIEVVRGATGLTQANSEPGGTINAVRKKPTAETHISGNAMVDRYGTVHVTNDISGSLNKSQTVRGRLVAVGEKSNSFKNNVDGSDRLIYGVIDADIGDSSVLTVGALLQNTHQTPDIYGVPMGAGGADLGLNTDSYFGMGWNKYKARKLNLFTEFVTYLSETWKVTHKINYVRNHSTDVFGMAAASTSGSYTGYVPGDSFTMQNLQRYDNNGEQFTYQFNITGKYNLFEREHDLFMGYTYSYEENNSRWRRVRNSTSVGLYDFDNSAVKQPDWNKDYNDQTYYRVRFISSGINLGSRFNIGDKWHLLAGGRYTNWRSIGQVDYDWWNNRIDTDADEYNITKRSRFIPYAGLTYDITKTHSFYAGYTSIFKPNSYKNLQGKLLPPVMGINYELGWKSDWFNNSTLNTSLALFRIIQKNRAIALNDTATNRIYYEPIGKVRSQGVELEISGALTENWKMFAGYTFNMSKYLETESSRYTQGMNFSKHTPKHMLRLYTSYRLPFDAGKWTVGGGISAQTGTESVYGVRQGGYTLWNANIQYMPAKNIKVSLIAANLTNKRYFENDRTRTNGINNFFGEPRNISLNINWDF